MSLIRRHWVGEVLDSLTLALTPARSMNWSADHQIGSLGVEFIAEPIWRSALPRLTSAATSGLFSQSPGGPECALGYELEEILIAPGVIGVAIGRAEDAGFAVLIDPCHGVGFSILFAHGTRQHFGVGPQLIYDIE